MLIENGAELSRHESHNAACTHTAGEVAACRSAALEECKEAEALN